MVEPWTVAPVVEGSNSSPYPFLERKTIMELISIETFDPEPYEILKTFSAVIQQHEEEYVAYYFDANLSATGDTKEEAIYNLKDILIATFDLLSSHDESELGLGPLRQIKLLKKVIRKIP